MRRGGTVLVVVVVAAIALAAGFDALRGDSGSERSAQPEPEEPSASTPSAEEEPPSSSEPFGGILYYTDRSCELQAAELPSLEPAVAPNWDECSFVLSPDGRRVAPAGSGWDAHSDPLRGRLFEAEDGVIQVSTNGGPEGEPFVGDAAAWSPGGALAYLQDDAVRDWPSGEVLLSGRDIVRELRSQGSDVARADVKEVVWMGDERLALIVALDRPEEPDGDVVAIFQQGRLVGVGAGGSGTLSGLRASPEGSYVAATSPQSVELFGPDGQNAGVPPLTDVRAFAFSPDERWVAAATDAGVYVFRPGSEEWTARLEIDAQDLAWRGEVGPPLLGGSDDAANWLADVGVQGRLFLTEPGCSLRALEVPSLAWAERPPGLPNPCGFTLDENDVVLPDDQVPQPGGDLVAVCQNDAVDVLRDDELLVRYPGACAPAWTPDGRLTFTRDGELFLVGGDRKERRLMSRADLREIFDRPSGLEEIAWVDDERFWAVVRSGETAIVALITADGLAFSPSFATRAIEGLRVSATGMVAARTDQGVVLFDSGGRRAMTFPNGRAVAWAPGELVAAVATSTEILFVALVLREVVAFPLAVRDLEWVVP
jgi:WD40-like Beta Propeller Repeat